MLTVLTVLGRDLSSLVDVASPDIALSRYHLIYGERDRSTQGIQ